MNVALHTWSCSLASLVISWYFTDIDLSRCRTSWPGRSLTRWGFVSVIRRRTISSCWAFVAHPYNWVWFNTIASSVRRSAWQNPPSAAVWPQAIFGIFPPPECRRRLSFSLSQTSRLRFRPTGEMATFSDNPSNKSMLFSDPTLYNTVDGDRSRKKISTHHYFQKMADIVTRFAAKVHWRLKQFAAKPLLRSLLALDIMRFAPKHSYMCIW